MEGGRGGERKEEVGRGGEGRCKVEWEQAKDLRSLLGSLVPSCAHLPLRNKVEFLGLILKKW